MQPAQNQTYEVRSALVDVVGVVNALGLSEGARRLSKGLSIRCPAHGDRTPSCSVRLGPDGTIQVKCHACDFRGDVLHLIAKVRGYNLRNGPDFREVLIEAAELAGNLMLAEEIRDGRPKLDRPRVEPPKPMPERNYPPLTEVESFWRSCYPLDLDLVASRYLESRAIDPALIMQQDLLRVIGFETLRPWWASKGGSPWLHTGHRIICRVWDFEGTCRGVRAWQSDGKTEHPKRLPPAGHKAAGLVLANDAAVAMLRGESNPELVVIVEGESDFASICCRTNNVVIGVGSGFWTQGHAAQIPNKARVWIMTDNDDAGDRYAAQIASMLGDRCKLYRGKP